MIKCSKVVSNTVMLYIMSIVKLILPLVTMPYLTRILSEDMYGLVAYVKNCMIYIQLIIDFGFILSSVKDIVNADGDKVKIGYIVGNTFLSKLLLSVLSCIIMLVMCFSIDILKINVTFVWLYFLSTVLTSFLADFLFRGIEKMHYITIIYLLTKLISTSLTFVFVKSDMSVMWIPILDIIANCVALVITFFIIYRLKIKIRVSNIKDCFAMLCDSFTYFLSSIATTAFSALNTILVGIYISDLTQVAYWSLCLSIVSSIQGLYAPICNGIYPHMIKEQNLEFIHAILKLFMPIVTIGCCFCFTFAKTALMIIGGEKYTIAYSLLRCMIPILFFSFPAQIYGWPTLGAIGKAKQTTISTIIASVAQVLGIVVLVCSKRLTVISLALLRGLTEMILMIVRMYLVYKNRRLFRKGK